MKFLPSKLTMEVMKKSGPIMTEQLLLIIFATIRLAIVGRLGMVEFAAFGMTLIVINIMDC